MVSQSSPPRRAKRTTSSTTITAMLLPDEEREGGKQALLERLNDEEQIERLRPILQDSLDARGKIMIASCPRHPEWTGRTIREVAAGEQRPPVEVALDVIRSGDEHRFDLAFTSQHRLGGQTRFTF